MKRRFLGLRPPASFIKTTYDISLDSQISLLPLGFSLLGVPWAASKLSLSLTRSPPRGTTQDRENPPPLVRTRAGTPTGLSAVTFHVGVLPARRSPTSGGKGN